jgi:hypothetical protein
MTVGNLGRVRWSIIFDPAGLNAAHARMLSAVIDADVRLMRLAEEPADACSEEALIRQLKQALTTRFPHVVFHVVCLDEDEP